MIVSDWEIERAAETVLSVLKDKDFEDGRFRDDTIAGQMQSLHLTFKGAGIPMKKTKLVKTWRELFYKKYERIALQKQLRNLTNIKRNTERKIKETKKLLESLNES